MDYFRELARRLQEIFQDLTFLNISITQKKCLQVASFLWRAKLGSDNRTAILWGMYPSFKQKTVRLNKGQFPEFIWNNALQSQPSVHIMKCIMKYALLYLCIEEGITIESPLNCLVIDRVPFSSLTSGLFGSCLLEQNLEFKNVNPN